MLTRLSERARSLARLTTSASPDLQAAGEHDEEGVAGVPGLKDACALLQEELLADSEHLRELLCPQEVEERDLRELPDAVFLVRFESRHPPSLRSRARSAGALLETNYGEEMILQGLPILSLSRPCAFGA
jgi:hypothetical protein